MSGDTHAPRSGFLMEMTIEDVRAFDAQVVVIPLASTEPHGPHLPYGTDYFIGYGITSQAVRLANAQGARVLLYPGIPIGNNVNFKAFPMACRIRVRSYMNMLLDMIEALEEDGIRKIVLVNSHGGNIDTIKAVLREHFERHPAGGETRAFVSYCTAAGFCDPSVRATIECPSDHAGESETSLVMHFQPHLVRPEKVSSAPIHHPSLSALLGNTVHFVRPWEKYMPESCGGDSRRSTPEKGSAVAESSAAGLASFLVQLSAAPWQPGFPYSNAQSS